MHSSKQPEIVYVRSSWPMQRYGFGRTKLWRDVKTGRFPAPRYLPGGQRRWLLAELLAWEAEHLGTPEAKP
jgi:predicted DNA-binding transcriptional regulator AlpA